MEQIAVFGEKQAGVDYQLRQGVYAVIPNEENDKISWFKHQMVPGFYRVEKLKKAKTTSLPWKEN